MNTQELTRQLTETQTRARVLLQRATQQSAAEGRIMTETEKNAVQAAIDEGKALKARLDRGRSDANMTAAVAALTGGMDVAAPVRGAGRGPGLGAEFVSSETFEWLKHHKGSLPTGSWTSPASELHATLLDESGGSGGGLVVPHYIQGIVETPTRPLTLADLFAPGVTDSNLVSYMKETAFTNAAATVAEGAAKPESTLVFAAASEPVKKIATWLPVTEEMLEDVPSLQSYLDARLRLAVQLAEEDQLLNGNAIGSNLNGVLGRAGLSAAVARGTDTNADAILKQMAAIQTATNLAADGIVLHPNNWLAIQLVKDANGNYLGSGPFASPQRPTLWGAPVAVTSAIPLGVALVGAFKSAGQLFRKGGLRVEATNAHASFFVENKIAIRAEERLALVLYREAGYGVVNGLN